jgi:transcriptional regulator with XRE-family HTH domain
VTSAELVGRRVKEARQSLRMPQKELGGLLKVYLGKEWAPQAVSAAEHGKRRFEADELLALSAVLHQPVAWFLTPDSGEQIQMPGGEVVERKDLLGRAAAPNSVRANLAISEQVEEALTHARGVVRELEKARKAGGVLAAMPPRRKAGSRQLEPTSDKQRGPS